MSHDECAIGFDVYLCYGDSEIGILLVSRLALTVIHHRGLSTQGPVTVQFWYFGRSFSSLINSVWFCRLVTLLLNSAFVTVIFHLVSWKLARKFQNFCLRISRMFNSPSTKSLSILLVNGMVSSSFQPKTILFIRKL